MTRAEIALRGQARELGVEVEDGDGTLTAFAPEGKVFAANLCTELAEHYVLGVTKAQAASELRERLALGLEEE